MEARVTSQSQSFRLVEKMEQASIHHGQEIRADLPNVRVLALAGSEAGQLLFCNMGPIRVEEILNRGDDRPLPTDVTKRAYRFPAQERMTFSTSWSRATAASVSSWTTRRASCPQCSRRTRSVGRGAVTRAHARGRAIGAMLFA
jgi:hypothetical protein